MKKITVSGQVKNVLQNLRGRQRKLAIKGCLTVGLGAETGVRLCGILAGYRVYRLQNFRLVYISQAKEVRIAALI